MLFLTLHSTVLALQGGDRWYWNLLLPFSCSVHIRYTFGFPIFPSKEFIGSPVCLYVLRSIFHDSSDYIKVMCSVYESASVNVCV